MTQENENFIPGKFHSTGLNNKKITNENQQQAINTLIGIVIFNSTDDSNGIQSSYKKQSICGEKYLRK